MIQVQFRAMGTDVAVVAHNEGAIESTRHWFESAEQICSRFRPDSELSQINNRQETRVLLSPVLGAVMREAQDARRRTDGLVDVGVGSAVEAWGYDRTFVEVADLNQAPARQQVPAWSVSGDSLNRPEPIIFDLGGIAKGWSCDIAVERGMAAIVSAGGDVRSSHSEAIVPIADPWGNIITEIQLGIGALATSSTTRRRWKVGKGEAHHLIDPRTGSPADSPILSATVLAETAAQAEAGAKAVLLLGAEGLAWADRCSWLSGALVVWNDGSVYATSQIRQAA